MDINTYPKHRSSFHREESKHEIDYDPTLNQHKTAPSTIKKFFSNEFEKNSEPVKYKSRLPKLSSVHGLSKLLKKTKKSLENEADSHDDVLQNENKPLTHHFHSAKKKVSEHISKHPKIYTQLKDAIVKLVFISSVFVLLFTFFYNYLTFYKTLLTVSPGLSKFYYSWATVTYTLYIVAGVLWTQTDNKTTFFYYPYLFWFISFASLVHMITSFVVEAVIVSEINEEPKKKSVQLCLILDMVFGIILCVISIYLSYKMYECAERYQAVGCPNIVGMTFSTT